VGTAVFVLDGGRAFDKTSLLLEVISNHDGTTNTTGSFARVVARRRRKMF
jgi:hypothetical protein